MNKIELEYNANNNEAQGASMTQSSMYSQPFLQSGSPAVKRFIPKNVERPQKSFKVPPDNSHGHFTPILKEKPNAIVALEGINLIHVYFYDHRVMSKLLCFFSRKLDCVLTADSDTGDYDHPYGAELDMFEDNLNRIQRVHHIEVSTFLALENTPLIYVDNISNLHSMIDDLRKEREIAVDLEVA